MKEIRILVATDGSSSSLETFKQMKEFANGDYHIGVIHIFDESKQYLPSELQSAQIYEEYKTRCLSNFPQTRFELIFRSKDANEKPQTQIMKVAKENNYDYLFIGYHGRKGPKLESTIMGQTTKSSIFNSNVPLIIVKNLVERSQCKSKGFNFLICMDSSKKSFSALDHALNFSRSDNDVITVLHITPKGELNDALRDQINEQTKTHQKKIKFALLESQFHPGQVILDYINVNVDSVVDFVFLGNNGMRAQLEKANYVSTLATKLIENAHTNVVIIP